MKSVLWVSVCDVSHIAVGEMKYYTHNHFSFIVVRLDSNTFSVFQSECPHKGGPLQKGELRDGKIICPWHSYEFDLITGEAVVVPYSEKYGAWRNTGKLKFIRHRVVDNRLEVDTE